MSMRTAFSLRLGALALIVMATLAATLWAVEMQLHRFTRDERLPMMARHAAEQSRQLDIALQREGRLMVATIEGSTQRTRDPMALARTLDALEPGSRFRAFRLEDEAGAVLFSRGEGQPRLQTAGSGALRWASAEGQGPLYRVVALDVPLAQGSGRWLLFAPVDGEALRALVPAGARLELLWRGRVVTPGPTGLPAAKAAAPTQATQVDALAGWSGAAAGQDLPQLRVMGLEGEHLPHESLWNLLGAAAIASLLLGWLVFGRWMRTHVERIDALVRATARFSEERDGTELHSDRLGMRMRGASHEVQQLWRSLQGLARSVDEAEETQQAAQQYLRDLNVYLEDRIEERTRELAEARDRALDSTRAKEQFLANMSHELRTPLTGLLGGLELVDPAGLPEQQRHLLGVARQSGEALLAVINEVLDYSKLEAGKFVLAQVPLKVPEVAQEAASLFASVALRKGVALDCVCEPGVETPFIGDPLRLRQVLLNLLGNALKFTDRGRVELRITRIARRSGSAVLLFSVKDSGIGISPSLQTQLFKPFVQAEEGAARKGSGLGLAISQKLVQAMGGEITVDSVHGQGSTFSFDLELAFAPQEQAASAPPTLAPAPTTGLRGRVLLVEDNPVNRLVAMSMLAPLGLEITEAEDGEQALERLREGIFDLVLMDCQMPVLDGFATTARIRAGDAGADRVRVPIVAFTANALDGDAQRCIAAGMDGYLSKPFTREQLAGTVGHWLSRGAEPQPSATRH